jgi:hypothetical protein
MNTRILRATPLALCLALAHPVSSQIPAPAAPAPLTAEQWREDLRFMAAEMEKRHANLYHSVSREAFAAAVADLDARIPTLQRNEIIVGMMRIAAMVGDGHTRVDPRKDARFGFASLPLKLYLFEDGLYVRAAAPEHAVLVGARIEAVGGVPVEEAVRRASELASRDNPIGPKLFVPLYLNMPDILHALKLSPRRDAAILKLRKGGRSWTATVPAGSVDPLWPPDTDISLVTPEGWVDARLTPRPPLWLQAPLDYHRLIELPEPRALYVQLNMVTDIKGQTLARFAARIGERAAAANPRALILDLRLNHGGNGGLRNPLVRELIKAEDEDTRLFVLTWRGTFSASQFILDDLDRLTDAVFVGEPASSKPSSFGDAYRMPMPNSGISVRSSLVWWQSGQNFDPSTSPRRSPSPTMPPGATRRSRRRSATGRGRRFRTGCRPWRGRGRRRWFVWSRGGAPTRSTAGPISGSSWCAPPRASTRLGSRKRRSRRPKPRRGHSRTMPTPTTSSPTSPRRKGRRSWPAAPGRGCSSSIRTTARRAR